MSNLVVLTGRLTSDPAMKQIGETWKAGFNLAVDRQFKRDGQPTADFPHVVAWGKVAEHIGAWYKKGKPMTVHGVIETGSYKDKNDKMVYTTEVRAEKVFFVPKDSSESN